MLTIGDLAAATSTKVVTIRYYEKIGLLPAPARTAANYRAYDGEHLERLRFIRRCRELGFTVEQTRALLDLAGEARRPCAEVDALAAEHLVDVERRVTDLQRLAHELRHLLRCCRGDGVVADCRILAALSPQGGAVGTHGA
jgi:Cu(I)-responsive transcriptional regulator